LIAPPLGRSIPRGFEGSDSPLRLLSLAAVTPPERLDNDSFLSRLAERTAADGRGGAEQAVVERRVRRLFDRAGTREGTCSTRRSPATLPSCCGRRRPTRSPAPGGGPRRWS
jgi:hypothetical protein